MRVRALCLAASVLLALAMACGKEESTEKPQDQAKPPNGPPSGEQSIEINRQMQQRMGIQLAVIQPQKTASVLTVPGQIMMDEQQTSHIGALADGLVTDVKAAPGDVVRAGQVLGHLHSHMIHETVASLQQAMANAQRQQAAVTYARTARDRYAHLYAIQAASLEQAQQAEQQLLQAQNDLADSNAAIHMEREHLSELVQVPPETLNAGNIGDQELVPIKSPIPGTVIARQITPGMVLQTGMETFTVSDLRRVWMIASAAEQSVSGLRVGEPVIVHSTAWPGESFHAKVAVIGATLDPATRTLPVRVTIQNPEEKLKPQMFVSAEIDEPGKRQAMFVPQAAVQNINGIDTVFVTVDGTHFTAQALKLGPYVNHQAEVLDGLQPGARIAAGGSFVIKSQMLHGALGEE